MVGYTPSSFDDMVFTDERIKVSLKIGKSDHHTLINAKKTRANEEGENEGQAHAVTAIPIQPSFPPTQQCHYSANNKPSPYPPLSYPQRQSLNQPQTRKPVEFTPIPVSYADFLPYLVDNSMVAITPTKVDPWVLVPITFRGLYVFAIRGLHILACRGLHALAFRGLRVLIFIPGPPPDIGGRPTVRAHPEREAITHLVCIPGQDFTLAAAKRRVWIMRTNMTTFTWIWMTLLFSNILPNDHNANLPLQMDRAHKTPSGPEEVQQGPGVSSSGYGPLSVLQGARSPSEELHPQRHPVDPEKSNRALGFPTLGSCPQDTQWTRRSPTRSWSCQALITGLCQFYGVPVTSCKGIRPPTNRPFIKKYCIPRQAQGETPQQPGDGQQRATDTPPSPLEFTSAHPQKGYSVADDPWPTNRQPSPEPKVSKVLVRDRQAIKRPAQDVKEALLGGSLVTFKSLLVI
ncbi:hypothetical protein HKD37_19G053142 [Glycine soja]